MTETITLIGRRSVLHGLALMIPAVLGDTTAAAESYADDRLHAAYPRSIVDPLGVSIQIPSASRMVVIGHTPGNLAFALGVGDRVIARGQEVDWPKLDVSRVRSIGWAGLIDAESLLSMRPDVILISDRFLRMMSRSQAVLAQVRAADVPVIIIPEQSLMDQPGKAASVNVIQDIITFMGKIFAAESTAQHLQSKVRHDIDELSRLKEARPLQRMIYVNHWVDGVYLGAGRGTLGDLMISLIGGQNSVAQIGRDFVSLAPEALLEIAPEIIIVGQESIRRLSMQDPIGAFRAKREIALTPAGRTGAILPVEVSATFSATQRLTAAALHLAHAVRQVRHSDMFMCRGA